MTRALMFMPLAIVLAAGAGLAQTSPVKGAATATPAAAVATVPASPVAAIVENPPDAVEPQGFTYNSEGRRDPFVSLQRRGVDPAPTGRREPGLAGLGTAEISLRGTVKSAGAYVGIVQGADSKTYIVRAGDKLSDGSIRTITADTMVIVQHVNDPLSQEKAQEVRKVLRQTEEGK